MSEQLPVEVVRSTRRKKTVQAHLVEGRVRVLIPATFSASEEQEWVDRMVEKIQRRNMAGMVDLAGRARRLSRRYDLPRPTTIEWSDRQRQRWGSCTPADGSIRISTRLAGMPAWVLDYVIVHELAHLAGPGHDARFHSLVDRYELAERARGYLIAKSS